MLAVRRPLHRRHRAARKPPYRQPAARSRSGRQGDPGRSKFFLSLQDDLMRIFPVESMDSMLGKLGLEQGESHHPPVGHQGHRARPGPRRSPQLRHPQEHSQVRRRDERSAQGDLRTAPRTDGRRHRYRRPSTACATTWSTRSFPRPFPSAPIPSSGSIEQLEAAAKTYLNVDVPIKAWSEEEGIDVEQVRERLIKARRREGGRQGRPVLAQPSCGRWKSRSCCSRSTGSGASTW